MVTSTRSKAKTKGVVEDTAHSMAKTRSKPKPKGPKVTPEDFQAVAASAKLANDKADMNSISISNHSKIVKFLYINQRRTQAVDLAIVVFLLVVYRSAIAENLVSLLEIIKRFWE